MKNRWTYKAEGFRYPPENITQQKSNPRIDVIGREPNYKTYLRIEDFGVVVTLTNKRSLRALANAILTAIGDPVEHRKC